MAARTETTKSGGAPSGARPEKITAAAVVAYLRAHPKFLARHPELFADLTPPGHRNGRNVLDMQSFIIDRLQSQIDEARDREGELVSACRGNLSSQGRIHAAVLALIEARGLDELIETVTTDLANLLDVDVASLCVEASEADQPRTQGLAPGQAQGQGGTAGIFMLEPGEVDARLGCEGDCLLRGDIIADERLFGGGASLVTAEALVRLQFGKDGPTGLLALGSRDSARFRPGQGTELLSFLAAVLALCIRGRLAVDG